MTNYTMTEYDNAFAPWQGNAAFNMYWQYSYVNRAAFYALVSAEYRDYMTKWVQNALWWYDGWVPYFHSPDQGIFSTKIAAAIVDNTARKVTGGRLMFKNAKKEKMVKDADGRYIVNAALAFIANEWSVRSNFQREVKKAICFAAAAGTSLLKLDKRGGELKVSAFRQDGFLPVVDFDGKVVDVVCFVKSFTDLYTRGSEQAFTNYYVVEHRYFAECGIEKSAPMVRYEIRRSTGVITSGQDYNIDGEGIPFADLPKKMKSVIGKAFDGIIFDAPVRLPFDGELGVQLVKWTDSVGALPELPFGEGMLTRIIPYLQSYDYYFSACNTDMYLGRGRVILPGAMQSAKASSQNSGWKDMIYSKPPYSGSGEDDKPIPVQFDLRSQSWTEIRNMLIQNIAMSEGLNVASVASFLQDNTASKTAREISTEESETALYVEDKHQILETPINALLETVTRYYGYTDTVVLRWNTAGLTNAYTRAEMTSMAVGGGFMSRQKALQINYPDLDEYQLQEEYDNILADDERKAQQQNPFGGLDGLAGISE